ncbi:MAG: PA0069 family radical SAM protein [Zoogloeaceae bacterium]|nr:PA0069 family radical SAM protein [Zoogloeaceae bacterium]
MSIQPSSPTPPQRRPLRGRGSASVPDSRFLSWQRSEADDGWPRDEASAPRTQLLVDTARHVITYNQSPDISFDRSINPYRGCEHGCAYCFARPSHAWLGLSPGLDFETQLFWKPDAPGCLADELAHPAYRPAPLALGVNTDAWQPVERQTGLTRQLLQILAACRHPVSTITKSSLIERDIDLLATMAKLGIVKVMVSITTLDANLARRLEPRAASPARRLETLRKLSEAGIPTGVMFAPLIPGLNDHELETVLNAAAAAGARSAGWVLVRLPHEVGELFQEWLECHVPDRAARVMSLIGQTRGGQTYDARFGHRMRGQGPLASLYQQRMAVATRRLGLADPHPPLRSDLFTPPRRSNRQGELF